MIEDINVILPEESFDLGKVLYICFRNEEVFDMTLYRKLLLKMSKIKNGSDAFFMSTTWKISVTSKKILFVRIHSSGKVRCFV